MSMPPARTRLSRSSSARMRSIQNHLARSRNKEGHHVSHLPQNRLLNQHPRPVPGGMMIQGGTTTPPPAGIRNFVSDLCLPVVFGPDTVDDREDDAGSEQHRGVRPLGNFKVLCTEFPEKLEEATFFIKSNYSGNGCGQTCSGMVWCCRVSRDWMSCPYLYIIYFNVISKLLVQKKRVWWCNFAEDTNSIRKFHSKVYAFEYLYAIFVWNVGNLFDMKC